MTETTRRRRPSTEWKGPTVWMPLLAALAISLFVTAVGCAVRTRNLCEPDGIERVGHGAPRDCHRCEDDAECTFQGNVCEGVVLCAHREAAVVSTAIGCSPEPSPPSDEACVCLEGYCQVR